MKTLLILLMFCVCSAHAQYIGPAQGHNMDLRDEDSTAIVYQISTGRGYKIEKRGDRVLFIRYWDRNKPEDRPDVITTGGGYWQWVEPDFVGDRHVGKSADSVGYSTTMVPKPFHAIPIGVSNPITIGVSNVNVSVAAVLAWWDLYKRECAQDSSWQWTEYTQPMVRIQGSGQAPDGYTTITYGYGEWLYTRPTFEGFMEYLRKRQ